MKHLSEYKLDTRTYAFTIDVYKFVKALKKAGITDENTTKLMEAAGIIGTTYQDVATARCKEFLNKIAICHENSISAKEALDQIDCNEELINEKSNLMIELNDFINVFKLLKGNQ